MAQTNWMDVLADRLRSMSRDEARVASPPVERGKIVDNDPLRIDLLDDDRTLEEGDEDVEIDHKLLDDPPDVGETVRVHVDGDGDYIVGGVIS